MKHFIFNNKSVSKCYSKFYQVLNFVCFWHHDMKWVLKSSERCPKISFLSNYLIMWLFFWIYDKVEHEGRNCAIPGRFKIFPLLRLNFSLRENSKHITSVDIAIAERGNRSGYPERSGKWNDSLNKLKFLGITRGWMRSDLLLADSPKTFLS